jgi:pimeloyl-ACP methyl ester carboxylesterase
MTRLPSRYGKPSTEPWLPAAESGLGDDARVWGKVQPELAKLTRVCSYDRSGLGWSDPRPGLRDSVTVANQLHGLLIAAGISGPVVLMGHSMAGCHMREYGSKYPGDIAGVVFVDAVTPSTGLARAAREPGCGSSGRKMWSNATARHGSVWGLVQSR